MLILFCFKLWLIPAIILYVWFTLIDEGGHIEKTVCFIPVLNILILGMFMYYICLDWINAFYEVVRKK